MPGVSVMHRPRSCLTLLAPFPPRRLPSQPCSCPCLTPSHPPFSVPTPFGRPSLAKCLVVPQPKHLSTSYFVGMSCVSFTPHLPLHPCRRISGRLFLVWVACLVDQAIPFVVQVAVPTAEEVVLAPGSYLVAEEYRRCFNLGKCGLLTANPPTAGPLFSWHQLRLVFLA